MAKFRKGILRVGTYQAPDGQVVVTADRLRHWANEFARMRAAGQSVPIDWDHGADLEDLTPVDALGLKARSAKNTVGEVADVRLAQDGQSLEMYMDVRSPRAIEQAELNNVYVSPVILPKWRDGHGNEYTDLFGHVDFVNHPVDHSQTPFAPVETGAVACAIRMGLSPPHFLTVTRMADNPLLDDADTDLEMDGAADEEEPIIPPADESKASVKEVLGALAEHDIVLPNDTTEGNFLDRLHAALLTAAAHKSRDETDRDAKVVQDTQGIAAMSLAKNAYAYAERTHRGQIAAKLKAMLEAGKCTPAEYREQSARLGTVKLSLDDRGEPRPSKVEEWIAAREAVPTGTFWDAQTRTRLSAVVDPPENLRGEMTSEEIQAKVDWALGRKPQPTK